jgi:hypothetical protein
MARLINWRSRLHSYLAGLAQTPFQPGTHDCSLFTAGAVEAIRGDDPAAPYRGNYTTVAGGLELLADDGYTDQVHFITANFPEKPVLEAQVGDIATVVQNGEIGVGIVIGPSVAVVTLRGLGHVPLSSAQRVFEVQ